MKIKEKIIRFSKILKFMSASFISFIIDYLSFIVFEGVIGISLIRSNLYARIISGTVNFFLNKKYVFQNGQKHTFQILQYIILASGIIFVNTVILEFLSVQLNIFAPIAKIVVEVMMFTLSYIIQKYIIFKK